MDLIVKFKQGDQVSFESIFDQLYHRLFAYGFQYLKNQEEVEDLVQESFLTLWNQRENFDHINAIKSFLYTTVKNKCLNQLRHQLVREKHEAYMAEEISQPADDHQIIEEEYYGRLYEEIKSLPASSQKIMLLALQGLKNREIAEQLNISENTVKTQKKIAYAKLKDKLNPALFGFLLTL
ncbi:MAG: RNA polymerase sigma-70 factor [Marinoscillum sp.]